MQRNMQLRMVGRAATVAVALLMMSATAVWADNVQNDVVAGGNDTIAAGGSTTINYRIAANSGDNQSGCNAADSSAATVTINTPAGVTASPGSLVFQACDTNKAVAFTSTVVGDHEITVSVDDIGAGTYNTNPAKFTLHVLAAANTPPSVSVTGVSDGATYEKGSVPAAGCSVTDAEDGPSTFAATLSAITGPLAAYGLGSQTASCAHTDSGGLSANASATYTIVDTTAPSISFVSRAPAANAAGWNKGDVTVSWSCDDGAGSGVVAPTVSATVSTEGANQSAEGTCTDHAGNTASDTQTGINIDKTAPGVSWSGGINAGDSFYFGSVPAAPTCTATDGLSGPKSCSVSGYNAAVGNHTLVATARDVADNEATDSRAYSVLAWRISGFYQPVDMNDTVNTVKGGSTVPLKFEVFAGPTELTDVSAIDTFRTAKVGCADLTGAATDEIEVTSTGGTSLRYDASGGQFIQNWQTPKGAGICYRATLTTDDGSTITAYFKTK